MELFPDPETPVTTVKIPTGIRMSTFRRLFLCAPSRTMNRPAARRRFLGISMNFRPDR